jgi:DNA-binding IclR family transcriptional regulator
MITVSGRNSEPGRSVLSKSFAILDALRCAQTDLTRAQISRRSGLPMTTVHRLATELLAHGALEMTERGGYRVGPWLWEVATLSARSLTLRDVALPFMQDLYEATHENVHLAVLDGHDALVLEKIRGRQSFPIQSRVGGRLALHATGAGKALLAFSPPSLREEIIAAGLVPYTNRTITTPEELRRDLEETRRRGFALSIEERSRHAGAVGAPIVDRLGNVLGSVSVIVDCRRSDAARLAPTLRTVALGIGRQLVAQRRTEWQRFADHSVDSRLTVIDFAPKTAEAALATASEIPSAYPPSLSNASARPVSDARSRPATTPRSA